MMQRNGKIIFAILVIGMMATAANAATLIDYWTFDETSGTNFANEIDERPAATMVNFEGDEWSGDVPTALTHSTGSLMFDDQYVHPSPSVNTPGDGEYLLLSNTGSDYNGDGTTGFSISMWLKPMFATAASGGTDDMRILCPTNQDTQSALHFNSSTLGFYPGSGSWQDNVYTGVADATWLNLTLTCQNGTMKIYVDGDLKATKTGSLDYSNGLMLGGEWQSANSPYNFYGDSYHGLIDDVSAWSGVLTPTEITALAAGASPIPVDVPEPATLCGLITLLLGGFFLRRRGC